MSRSDSLILSVWREACRHIELGEFSTLVAPLLSERIPFQSIALRRIDIQRSFLETEGVGVVAGAAPPAQRRDDLTAEQMDDLLAWCRRGELLHWTGRAASGRLDFIVPSGVREQVLAGPLTSGGVPAGVVILTARPGAMFEPAHESLLRSLLEPFSVALENDRRLDELTELREAAEADKRSLLTRLGRQEITDAIVGAEAGLRPVMSRVRLVAPSDVPVLIFGETGSGKEVIARAIHTGSRRAGGPFLRVNCGAIPPELIDSELFGHEKGSFTGAVTMRKGWFERADGGTLFLDEVGELPPAAQVRLLRVLQDGTFERVGGQAPLHVDVRVVAATHRDLPAMVADGRFRQDLWYRIGVFPLHLPALRERPEDIPALATHFCLRSARRFGTAPLIPTQEDLHLLLSYSWPGNVRELAAVIDRATILGNGRKLEFAKALGTIPTVSANGARPASMNAGVAASGGAVAGVGLEPSAAGFAPATGSAGAGSIETLDRAMARHIERVLIHTYGRVEGPHGAARLLGINPHTLRARMRKLGVDWRKYRAARGGDGDSGG